jgi:hypothetical protein
MGERCESSVAQQIIHLWMGCQTHTASHVWRRAALNTGLVPSIGEVVSTSGLDLAFIGPGNLATNMGHRKMADHPEVQAALWREEAIRLNPVALGGVAAMAIARSGLTAFRMATRFALGGTCHARDVDPAGRLSGASALAEGGSVPVPPVTCPQQPSQAIP